MLVGVAGWLCSLCASRLRVLWLVVAGALLCTPWVGVAGASLLLPDGRAWEMVSPLAKNGGDIRGIDGDSEGGVVQASPDGQRITYVSLASFGGPLGAAIGSQYLSTRGEGGWSTQNVSTPMSAQVYKLGNEGTPFRAFSLDLSSGLVFGGNRGKNEGGEFRPVESPPLAPGAPVGYMNYYVDRVPGGALRSLLTEAPGVPPEEFGLTFLGGTPDLGHVVVESSAALGASVPGEMGSYPHLYEWEAVTGQFKLVNVLPSGSPESTGVVTLGGGGATGQAVSEDGSQVIWTGESHLYVREGIGTAQARTVQADAAGIGKHGVRFLTASSDGSKVFFTDEEGLTKDFSPKGSDLYMFEPGVGENGRLVDLTVDHVDAGGAEVQGVLGASADGSYLYFVANGRLNTGATTPGSCRTGQSSPAEVCNLYLWHEGWGKPKFIATLTSNDEGVGAFNLYALGEAFDWNSSLGPRTARVSHDGLRAVFMSQRSLTGYDNTVSSGEGCGVSGESNPKPLPAQCEEVFLYEASSVEGDEGRLSCVSCNPSGARPVGPSGIPGGTQFTTRSALYQSRVISEGGAANRVFFDSADALVPGDSNGVGDVYVYENGRASLLSDGVSPGGASFVDASVNGDDAFFTTRAQLVGQDTDQLRDLYDARAPHTPGESIGFPVSQVVGCESEDCRPANASPPAFTALSTVTLVSSGNVAPAVSAPAAMHKAKKAKKKRRRARVRTRVGHGRRARAGHAGSGVARGRGGR